MWLWQSIRAGVTSRPPIFARRQPGAVHLGPDLSDPPAPHGDSPDADQAVGRRPGLHCRDPRIGEEEIGRFQRRAPFASLAIIDLSRSKSQGMAAMQTLFAPEALLPEGGLDVRVTIDAGRIASVEREARPAEGDTVLTGRALLPVELEGYGVGAQFATAGGDPAQFLAAPGAQDQVGSAPCEGERGGEPNSAGSAGDDDRGFGELIHGACGPLRLLPVLNPLARPCVPAPGYGVKIPS